MYGYGTQVRNYISLSACINPSKTDHDLDDPAESKLNVFSGRGILVESRGPVWLVGTASEHHVCLMVEAPVPHISCAIQVIYQYAFHNARDIWAGLIQTETPYFQPTPNPPTPFSLNPKYGDPSGISKDAWGLVISASSNIWVYGAGIYSFFQVRCTLGVQSYPKLIGFADIQPSMIPHYPHLFPKLTRKGLRPYSQLSNRYRLG
jgi:hypothetical protein